MSDPRSDLELAAVAVSLPGWRWVAGMRFRAASGGPVAVEDGVPSPPDSVPVISDPAAAGGLLSLLGGRCVIRILPREDGTAVYGVVVPSGLTPDGRPHGVNEHSLGRACVLAAEIIGRWPGGDR